MVMYKQIIAYVDLLSLRRFGNFVQKDFHPV